MSVIADQLDAVRRRILDAAHQAGRPDDAVQLLAVSKTFPADDIRTAYAAGQRAFGENYVQESIDKIAALDDLRSHIEWHFIGPLQSNKTRQVAEAFDWVHTIDRLKIATRLSDQRPAHLPPLNVCVQVNISGEASKSGVMPSETLALMQAVAALPRLRLRGLMAIPEAVQIDRAGTTSATVVNATSAAADNPAAGPATDAKAALLAAQRAPHRALHRLLMQAQAAGLAVDTLSAGMSADLEAAVLEGATLVRIGTAIFGHRDYGTPPSQEHP